MTELDLISKFNSSYLAKQFAIAYGGDGQLLNVVANIGNKKAIIPIRNYGRCNTHANILKDIVEKNNNGLALKYSKQHFIDYNLNGENHIFKNQLIGPISEVVWKSADPTEALRFTVIVNEKIYMKQCIADGIICSTALGSHGYFKSVTRTLFNDTSSIGIGFIAPTYGLCNLVLKLTDKITIILERDAKTVFSADKCFKSFDAIKGTTLNISLSVDGVALYGYDIFCCPECRYLRNSTLINDQYLG